MADEHHESHLTDLAVALHARRSPEAVLAAFVEAVPEAAERAGIELADGVLTFAPDALAPDEAGLWARRAAILRSAVENAAAHKALTRAESMLRSLIEQLFGSTVSDWMQGLDGWAGQIHPDDREEVLRSYTAAVAAAAPYEREYRLIDTAGRVRWVWDTAVTVFDADGAPQAVHGVIFEVTKRKLAEQALTSSQALLRCSNCQQTNRVRQYKPIAAPTTTAA